MPCAESLALNRSGFDGIISKLSGKEISCEWYLTVSWPQLNSYLCVAARFTTPVLFVSKAVNVHI